MNKKNISSHTIAALPCNYIESGDRMDTFDVCTVCGDTRYGGTNTKCASALAHLEKVGVVIRDAGEDPVSKAAMRVIVRNAQADAVIGFAKAAADSGVASRDVLMNAASKTAATIRDSANAATKPKTPEVDWSQYTLEQIQGFASGGA